MTVYTVYEPPAKRKEKRRGPDRFVFVRDGFYFWAFLLTPLWMLWRRLFLVFIGYVVLSIALQIAVRVAGGSDNAAFAVHLLLSLLIGLEAGSLRRWTLRRRKWRELGIVSADKLEAAERRFFDAWEGDEGVPFLPTSPPAGSRSPLRRAASPSDVVGLFPEPGARR